MLKPLIIPDDELTPKIVLDKQNNYFEISGKSLPENADIFFTPVTEWVKQYVQDPNTETVLNVKLNYFNSSSVRKVVDILILFEKLCDTESKILLRWYYESGDEMIRDVGKDFQSVVKIPFQILPYESLD